MPKHRSHSLHVTCGEASHRGKHSALGSEGTSFYQYDIERVESENLERKLQIELCS